MKYLVIAVAAFTGVFYAYHCDGQKSKKAAYEFPAAMSDAVRAGYTQLCDKGQILYQINCAKCHMVTINGKQMIPDFNQEELAGYEIRILNPKHESDLPETTLTAEELGQIMTFLSYKKKNPAAK